MSNITEAELWDRRLERLEWLAATAEDELGDIINLEKVMDLLFEVRKAAQDQAIKSEWQIADRVLTFADNSRLLLIAGDANTAAGDSRVLRPTDETETRLQLRDGSPYEHGSTRYSWLTFPPHDSFADY